MSDDRALELAEAFQQRYGTWPTTAQIWMMLEADSSTRLDGETIAIGGTP